MTTKAPCCEKCEEPGEELFEGHMITTGDMVCGDKKCPCHETPPVGQPLPTGTPYRALETPRNQLTDISAEDAAALVAEGKAVYVETPREWGSFVGAIPLLDAQYDTPREWESEFDDFLLGDFKDGLHVPRTKAEWVAFIRSVEDRAREELEANLENSAWAKTYKLMCIDEERARIREIVEGKRKPSEDDDGPCNLDHNAALDDILREI